jgi:hypothetical protein
LGENCWVDEIHYAGDTVYTGSEIAHALLEYARALAQKGASATVEIPVYHADGTRGQSEFLIGPASQLVSDTAVSKWDEIVDPETVDRLRAAARALGANRVLPADAPPRGGEDLEFPDFGSH